MGSRLYRLVLVVLAMWSPGCVFGSSSRAAVLYTNGVAWVNGVHVPRSSLPIFTGDLVQTRSDSVANIDEIGSIITVSSDSLVQFEIAALKIEHGALTIATSSGIAATAGVVRIVPAKRAWTEFDVSDLDGTVRIVARKGDLTITDGAGTSTLSQGQETTRDDASPDSQKNSKKNRKRGVGAAPAAGGGILNSPYALGIGSAAAIGVTTWVLLQSDQPASPTIP